MELKRPKTKRVYENIVENIQQLIKDKVLSPGDQLLPERQLAEKMGVSRTAVREALTALSSKGLIEITPGGGAYVKEVSLDDLIDLLATIMLREKEDVEFLLEARKILEVETIKLAAERASSVDLLQIKEAALEHQSNYEQGLDVAAADVSFHLSITRASQNPILYNMMSVVTELMKESYGPSRKEILKQKEIAEMFDNQHFKIYEAIKKRDSEEAAQLMYKHLDSAKYYINLQV